MDGEVVSDPEVEGAFGEAGLGEGLEELENLKYDIDSILDFCGWDSPTLAERYQGFKQEEDELGSFNSRGGLGM